MRGYPVPPRVFSEDEIRAYFEGDRIVCLICGRTYRLLGVHLARAHDMTIEDYRERYGLPFSRGLASDAHCAMQTAHGKARAERGEFTLNDPDAPPKGKPLHRVSAYQQAKVDAYEKLDVCHAGHRKEPGKNCRRCQHVRRRRQGKLTRESYAAYWVPASCADCGAPTVAAKALLSRGGLVLCEACRREHDRESWRKYRRKKKADTQPQPPQPPQP
jgi:hypothetical protein